MPKILLDNKNSSCYYDINLFEKGNDKGKYAVIHSFSEPGQV